MVWSVGPIQRMISINWPLSWFMYTYIYTRLIYCRLNLHLYVLFRHKCFPEPIAWLTKNWPGNSNCLLISGRVNQRFTGHLNLLEHPQQKHEGNIRNTHVYVVPSSKLAYLWKMDHLYPGWNFRGGLGAKFYKYNVAGPNLDSYKKIGPNKDLKNMVANTLWGCKHDQHAPCMEHLPAFCNAYTEPGKYRIPPKQKKRQVFWGLQVFNGSTVQTGCCYILYVPVHEQITQLCRYINIPHAKHMAMLGRSSHLSTWLIISIRIL